MLGPTRADVDAPIVADLDVAHVAADSTHDARAVAAAGVEVLRLAGLLALGDDVDRVAERRPHVVVVDAGGHDVDEHLVGADRRGGDDLALPGVAGLAEAVRAHDVGVHPWRHLAKRRAFSQSLEVPHRGSPPLKSSLARFTPLIPSRHAASA